jgi:hypothetical protein
MAMRLLNPGLPHLVRRPSESGNPAVVGPKPVRPVILRPQLLLGLPLQTAFTLVLWKTLLL